jgi:stress response protein SCP2
MSVKLQKGQKVSLSKDRAGLSKILVGLGWDEVKVKRGFFKKKCVYLKGLLFFRRKIL